MSESLSKNMRFDVLSIPKGGNVLHKFKDLERIQSFKNYPGTTGGELNQDLVIKYVVLLYSTDSFLNGRPIIALNERKMIAADESGFVRNKNNEFNENVTTKLFELRSTYVFDMIMEFLAFQNNSLWISICSTEQALIESNKIIMQPVQDDKDKDNVASMKNKLQLIPINADTEKILKSLYHDFFNDNTDVKEGYIQKGKTTLESLARPA